jgi:hypothetical protein
MTNGGKDSEEWLFGSRCSIYKISFGWEVVMKYRDKGYRDETDYHGGYGGNYYGPKDIDVKTVLAPLINQIRKVDKIRLMLEQKGGKFSDLRFMTSLLKEEFTIEGHFDKHKVSLTNHTALNHLISDISHNLHLQIRRLPTNGLPVFHIVRTRNDYWSEYSIVLEDIYRSDGYIIPDERFVKLMHYTGHEVYYLRMSPFFNKTQEVVSKTVFEDMPRSVDRVLYSIGSSIMASAWHDDQRVAILCAKLFGMKSFMNAIELLYLALNSDLCEIRSMFDKESVTIFFNSIYPQPSILTFLDLLASADGDALNNIPKLAQRCYLSLSKKFNGFLAKEVIYGNYGMKSPIYKVLFGNLSRLDTVYESLEKDDELSDNIKELERVSELAIEEIISGTGKNALEQNH